MKTAKVLILLLCGAGTASHGQAYYNVSRDYLAATNPGPAWSYGWKPSLTGTFNSLTYHLTQPVTENSGWELWARAIGAPTSVYRNTGTETLISDGGRAFIRRARYGLDRALSRVKIVLVSFASRCRPVKRESIELKPRCAHVWMREQATAIST